MRCVDSHPGAKWSDGQRPAKWSPKSDKASRPNQNPKRPRCLASQTSLMRHRGIGLMNPKKLRYRVGQTVVRVTKHQKPDVRVAKRLPPRATTATESILSPRRALRILGHSMGPASKLSMTPLEVPNSSSMAETGTATLMMPIHHQTVLIMRVIHPTVVTVLIMLLVIHQMTVMMLLLIHQTVMTHSGGLLGRPSHRILVHHLPRRTTGFSIGSN